MIPHILAAIGGFLIGNSLKRTQFSDGGGVLLAPNGNPSNLTPEQYRLVRTPEFKAWFGDWENDPGNASKVVDNNGEPMVLWHFSRKLLGKEEKDRFHIFRTDRQLGAHFGSLKQTAYISRIAREAIESGNLDFKFFQVFLNLRNPVRMMDTPFWEFDYLREELGFPNSIEEVIEYGIDGIIYLNRFEINTPNIIEELEEEGRISDAEFKKYVPEAEDSWIVFEPKNIKLADGTNTTFDSNNPDIRFDTGGVVSEITLLKNKIKAPKMKGFGQEVEPAGYYAIEKITDIFDSNPNYETITIRYKKPLFIDVTPDDLISWKYELSKKYNAKGKALTAKLIKRGYDIIITRYPEGDYGEIVALDTGIRYDNGGLVFTNWEMPSLEQLKKEYRIEHEMKGNNFFDSESDFLNAIHNAEIVEITPEDDMDISYRSRRQTYESLLSLIRTYRSYPEFRNEKTLSDIYDGYRNNEPMDYPIVIEFSNGRKRVFSGNTRMDIAFQLGINPKVLLISSKK